MEKKNIVLFSIISTILSLIWILLTYFGFIRYITLHIKNNESYINNYHKLDKGDKNNRVVISLTTTPKNISKIGSVITSLIDQTVQIDEIALSIPYGTNYKIPDNIKNIVKVYRLAKNYDKASNVIPTIAREGDTNTKIIFLNDNMIYGRDFIEDILANNKEHPGTILTHKNAILLIEPEFYNSDVCDYPLGSDINTWLINKCNSKKHPVDVKYSENYKAYFDW